MNPISELRNSLNKYFEWNKARMECFTKMLISIISVKTINLREIAVGMKSNAQIDSRYRRIQRFFAGYEIDLEKLGKFIFGLFFDGKEKVYLSIDRTNWYFGKAKINILTLGIAYEGLAIPILWKVLDKAGNATGKEHAEIVERFVKLFGKESIGNVLADREFANQDFFEYLKKERLPFTIRVKNGAKVNMFGEKGFRVEKLFKDVKVKEQKRYIQPVNIHGQKLFAAGGRSERGELLIVATNTKEKNPVSTYLRRWEIESLFQSLKSRGFRFEETHITKHERIEKLMALLAIAFSWAHKIGEWRAIKKPIIFKKFRNSTRPQYSFFRYGLDFMRDVFLHIKQKQKYFFMFLAQLFSPPKALFLATLEELS